MDLEQLTHDDWMQAHQDVFWSLCEAHKNLYQGKYVTSSSIVRAHSKMYTGATYASIDRQEIPALLLPFVRCGVVLATRNSICAEGVVFNPENKPGYYETFISALQGDITTVCPLIDPKKRENHIRIVQDLPLTQRFYRDPELVVDIMGQENLFQIKKQ